MNRRKTNAHPEVMARELRQYSWRVSEAGIGPRTGEGTLAVEYCNFQENKKQHDFSRSPGPETTHQKSALENCAAHKTYVWINSSANTT